MTQGGVIKGRLDLQQRQPFPMATDHASFPKRKNIACAFQQGIDVHDGLIIYVEMCHNSKAMGRHSQAGVVM
jgi:hypothetical protein